MPSITMPTTAIGSRSPPRIGPKPSTRRGRRACDCPAWREEGPREFERGERGARTEDGRVVFGVTVVLENEDEEPLSKRQVLDIKKETIRRLVELLDKSGRAGNPNKLLNDLFNREKNNETRQCAALALGELGTQAAIEVLRKMQSSKHKVVRDAAAISLKKAEGQEMTRRLQ